ncbi:MAG: hypothetical protein KKF56_00335 [Nanoarchaeota archaeon]|nr:hypothetical protein [Nanoarchaeota archaeon]
MDDKVRKAQFTEDEHTLRNSYSQVPPVPKMDVADFSLVTISRIRREWCCEPNQDMSMITLDRDPSYREAFLQFIDKETHHAVERTGFQYNQDSGRFINPEGQIASKERYEQARYNTIQMLARRASEFFRKFTINARNQNYQNGRNLRGSLAPHKWATFPITTIEESAD